jgi:1-deoxy-D-xylulose-5-phosphate synthase
MRHAGRIAGAALKKTLIQSRNIFDDFGVRYIGPVPGHDLPTLTGVLDRVSRLRGPVLVHVVTRKGKGFDPAECDATTWHGIAGECSAPGEGRTFTSAFSSAMIALGEKNSSLVAITAAMRDGTGLAEFSTRFPRRFFDVGIAEQHAVTFACGLAFGGLRPVVAMYSTFMQRAVDQLIHDAALQKAPIVLALDRCGAVGEDGPTHHGMFDIPLLRSIPNIRIASPRSCAMLASVLELAVGFPDGPTAIRYPRGSEPVGMPSPPVNPVPGRGQILKEGTDVLLVGCGVMAAAALEASALLQAEGVSAMVYDPIWLKPAPIEEIIGLGTRCGRVVSLEDGCLAGGFGEMLTSELAAAGTRVLALGFPDMFQQHGTRSGLLSGAGLDPESIRKAVREFCR